MSGFKKPSKNTSQEKPAKTYPKASSEAITKSTPVEKHTAITVPLTAARQFIDGLLDHAVANELAAIKAFTVTDVVHTLCVSPEKFKIEFQARYDDIMPGLFIEVLTYVCRFFAIHNMYAPNSFNSKTADNMEMSIRELSDFNNPNASVEEYALYCKSVCDSFRVAFDKFLEPGHAGNKLSVSLKPAELTLIQKHAYGLFAVNLENRNAELNTLIMMLLAIHESVLRCLDNIDIMKKQLTMLMRGGRYNANGAIEKLDELQGKLKNIFAWDMPSNYKTYILHVKSELYVLLTSYATYVSTAFMNGIHVDKLNNNDFVAYSKRIEDTKETTSTYKGLQTFSQQVVPRTKFNNSGKWTDTSFQFSLDNGVDKDPSIFNIVRGINTDVTAVGSDIKLIQVKWSSENNDVQFHLGFPKGKISKTYFHFEEDSRSRSRKS